MVQSVFKLQKIADSVNISFSNFVNKFDCTNVDSKEKPVRQTQKVTKIMIKCSTFFLMIKNTVEFLLHFCQYLFFFSRYFFFSNILLFACNLVSRIVSNPGRIKKFSFLTLVERAAVETIILRGTLNQIVPVVTPSLIYCRT